MQTQSNYSTISKKIEITISDLPRARRAGTGEMITGKRELVTKLTTRGILRATTLINNIFSTELSSPEDYTCSKKGSPNAALFISTNGIEKLVEAINVRINNIKPE